MKLCEKLLNVLNIILIDVQKNTKMPTLAKFVIFGQFDLFHSFEHHLLVAACEAILTSCLQSPRGEGMNKAFQHTRNRIKRIVHIYKASKQIYRVV